MSNFHIKRQQIFKDELSKFLRFGKTKSFMKQTFTTTMNSMTIFKIVLLFTSITQLAAVGWDYEANGPDSWFKAYEKCSGNIQSPINIDDENGITYDNNLLPFVLGNYENTANFNISNTGGTGCVKMFFLCIKKCVKICHRARTVV